MKVCALGEHGVRYAHMEVSSLIPLYGSENQIKIIRLGSKYLYLLSILPALVFFYIKTIFFI